MEMPVPQGVPGTNPQKMSESIVLQDVPVKAARLAKRKNE